jgi:3',5'-cyclic AMP phosphodiesterase CpdA
MKVLITSDLQFSDNPRDAYRFGIRDQITDLIKHHNVDWLYILGDLTEAKDQHPASLVNKITSIIRTWSRHTKVLILQGNHDYLDIAHPFFEFLKNFDGVKWVAAPTTFNGAIFLPHTRHYARDWNDLDLYGQVYAHNIFEGTKAGNGHVLDGIPLTEFQPNTRIVSGDVHEPQSFGCVTYVGSPYTCDHGDDYDPRVLLIEGDKMTSIPVSGPQKRLVIAEVE